jgi:hypothetical protein
MLAIFDAWLAIDKHGYTGASLRADMIYVLL